MLQCLADTLGVLGVKADLLPREWQYNFLDHRRPRIFGLFSR